MTFITKISTVDDFRIFLLVNFFLVKKYQDEWLVEMFLKRTVSKNILECSSILFSTFCMNPGPNMINQDRTHVNKMYGCLISCHGLAC